MVIVAFLQNLWAKDPVRLQKSIDRYGRQLIIKELLFSGSVTGRRIYTAFGDLVDLIVWEEASPEIAPDAKTICKPDVAHIQSVLKTYQPDVVVTFGNVAFNAVAPLWTGKLIHSPHPAARGKAITAKLDKVACELREAIEMEGL